MDEALIALVRAYKFRELFVTNDIVKNAGMIAVQLDNEFNRIFITDDIVPAKRYCGMSLHVGRKQMLYHADLFYLTKEKQDFIKKYVTENTRYAYLDKRGWIEHKYQEIVPVIREKTVLGHLYSFEMSKNCPSYFVIQCDLTQEQIDHFEKFKKIYSLIRLIYVYTCQFMNREIQLPLNKSQAVEMNKYFPILQELLQSAEENGEFYSSYLLYLNFIKDYEIITDLFNDLLAETTTEKFWINEEWKVEPFDIDNANVLYKIKD